ncbi:hypothetical protein K2173_015456 [Erythroxylum novogranatense]|uniref:BAH domain-containing protein n=1 Tax=Erythroxylum novogranatense TaxID=1862640 RepID=A0AAV8SSL2_9ROSI|nr:hypothetical protein K2173_015456 [Erythroxylum novogranatense]
MTGSTRCFVEWKEQFVSQERGRRVVHYFLKDSAGESVLAVVGTERSVRHMFYIVAEEFVRLHGPENSIHAGFKWRSRREVVDWLTSMLSKQHLQEPKHDLVQASKFLEGPMIGYGAQPMQNRCPKDLSGYSADIVWAGNSWTSGKQLKHYPAFCRNGTKIMIQSFVFVMAKGENHYVAYLEDMYEDKRGQKKVKVRWFHDNREVKGTIHLRNPHPKEVFITPYSQVISAECVDGPATVLTREHYDECLAAFSDAFTTKLHFCSRQFRSNKVKPFDVRKLCGYFEQPILRCLSYKPSTGVDSMSYSFSVEDKEESSPTECVKLGAKRARSDRGREIFLTEHAGIQVAGGQMITNGPSFRSLRYGFSGNRLLPLKHVKPQRWYNSFKIDEKIELLCQDSGIRGCWFRCTVLQMSKKHIKVRYDDVQDEDECNNLEEWVPVFKLAVPDKLGMRCLGRSTIRPAPPLSVESELSFEIGSAVDAWWSDGWWEGIVVGISNSSNHNLQVYSLGENFILNVQQKDLRISRDWVGDQWIDIQAKDENVLSIISTTPCPEAKMPPSSKFFEDMSFHGFDTSNVDVHSNCKLDTVEELRPDIAPQTSSGFPLENMDCDAGTGLSSSNDKSHEDNVNATNIDPGKVDDVENSNECEADEHVKEEGGRSDLEMIDSSVSNCKVIELREVTN